MKVHDITRPLAHDMPTFPGEPGPSLTTIHSLGAGDPDNVTALFLGSHTGTHVDAPLHFLAGGSSVDQLPLQALVGPVWVVELATRAAISSEALSAAELPDDARRLLLKTPNGHLWEKPGLQTDYVALAPDAATWLVERGTELVGIDYLSIEAYDAAPYPVHHTLLSAGVVIVEGLDLRNVAPGRYLLACLPLKVVGAEAAPARVVLIEGL